MLLLWLLLAALRSIQCSQVLVPPDINIAVDKPIHATATCGEMNGEPYREVFCQIAGSSQYTPLSQYSYNSGFDNSNPFREMKSNRHSFIQGGQGCDFCEANTTNQHPASFMVDGRSTWWQSPPLSRGKQYEQVNITIDLEQEFHVAYVWVQMANSPRPGKWVLEKSVDYGETYTPWQYFAESYAECQEFGQETLEPILRDDSVICTTEFSHITPLENGEMMIKLLEKRPGSGNFSHSEVLQEFAKATNVRLRLLRTKTLHGHLISVQKRKDPSVTRRHFYAIKEIFMGGRCVCNGHASSCDVLDVRRPHMLLCRCEHNTCGDQCEKCCPGYEQKKWQRAKDGQEFHCEPCNCHGHSNRCVYDEEVNQKHLSLDIRGQYVGGGRCLDCRHHTEGINCNKCVPGYYRPYGKNWNDIDVCQPCRCNPRIHSDICEEETGKCKCKPQFVGPNCDQCAVGYHSPPACVPCDCSSVGTAGNLCMPKNGQCTCKPNYDGQFCDKCSPGFTNKTGTCEGCNCNPYGSVGNTCDMETGQCDCRVNFAGLLCDRCADGYYDYPRCEYCNCDPSGTEGGLCDEKTGTCLCKPGYVGSRCDQCDSFYYGYPTCEECKCDKYGSTMSECELKTGECTCRKNFIGRRCDRCKPGYYDYPNCKSCNCHVDGSEGLSCDNNGKCFCKPNFQGDNCDECKPNFYNFPLCEECRCDPSGVSKDFGGCDKVKKGKLCECKKNVEGRICNRCKPTFWGLDYQLEDGCKPCNCSQSGTIGGLNTCNPVTGQCQCKEFAAGRDCNICAEGYYNLEGHNIFGCQPCNCNKGGSIGIGCDIHTGQCYCRPRVTGLKCDEPITDHYIPTLWHNKYEAEDGRTVEGDSVRYASDHNKFRNFSSKGFAVFSETQDEILIPLNIQKSTLYQVLLMYVNPTSADAEVELTVVPSFSSSQNAEQTVSDILPSSERPVVRSVNKQLPFALNPGTWTLHIKISKRIFLDYITLLPSEYYEASLLKDILPEPCKNGDDKTNCIKTSYPPLPYSSRMCASDYKDGNQINQEQYELMEKGCNNVVDIDADDEEKQFQLKLKVPETSDYVLVMEYNNSVPDIMPFEVAVEVPPEPIHKASATVEYCPYGIYCRSLAVQNGLPAKFHLEKDSEVTVTVTLPVQNKFGLASVNLIKTQDWDSSLLKQAPVCTMKNGKCTEQTYPLASNEVVREAKSGPNSNKAVELSNLPFSIAAPPNTKVLLLDEQEKSFNIESSVSGPGQYVFIVNYYNLDNGLITIPVYLNTDNFYDCILPMQYCPNQAGCRAVVQDIKRNDATNFYVTDKFEATVNYNSSQKGPVYINSIIAVPVQSYSDTLLKLQPVDASEKFIKECGHNEFMNAPSNVTQFCRDNVFALTTDFNSASFPCKCNHEGSKSFSCEEYGGQCLCRPNIIGRQCNQCEPGYYDFPYCRKCNCLIGQTCNERTGQCYCPRHVEGQLCDRCVQYAYGYDPLIGCQLCQCHPNGLDTKYGSAQCDSNNGQCLCKAQVGGRKCDQCLSGYYGFPHCYRCACDLKGTTENICDSQTSECICKVNVEGSSCDRCKAGKFNLEESNSLGCSECFCFGATDRCVSSPYSVDYVYFDREAWDVTDPKGSVKHSDGQVHYYAVPSDTPVTAYYKVPITPETDFTASYGLTISYRISSLPSTQNGTMTISPDLKLIGHNMTLEYWVREPPMSLKDAYSVYLKLIPENFIFENGAVVKRSDLMLVLVQLNGILVKASYYENTNYSLLTDFLMETAINNNGGYGVLTATSVEVCQCPASYTGDSCQYCADGFYRVKTGSYLGACVACDCNGHSGYCDKETGVCIDCQHHTHGDHCELCEVGYYGNATRGMYGCLACLCPNAYNNFATSCMVNDHGILESCTCQEGYTGERCERCATGYFGEPNNYGGRCVKCSCNDNNDLTVDGSCNPADGRCDNCLNNTAGDHCEICDEWYFGDAVEGKNCTDCGCDRCGSNYCDKESGVCHCKANIEGEKCDRCVPNAWGLSRCIGCDMCNCGRASRSEQCDEQTGQCDCMPGSAGARCDTCDHGYWNYTAEGCTKCDCEADLSLGTVCDINTGQCHCQEGATGPRCDQCLISYLRIPDYGCRMCDECVLSLVGALDVVDEQQGALQHIVNHMSPAALAGARLTRISKTIAADRHLIDGIVALKTNGSIDEVKAGIDAQKEAALVTAARARDSYETLTEGHKELEELLDELKELQNDLKNRIEVSHWTLEKFDALRTALTSRRKPVDTEELQKKAEKTLAEVKKPYLWQLHDGEVDVMAKQIDDYKNKLEEMIEATIEDGSALKQKINESKSVLDGIRSNASDLRSMAEDYIKFLNKVVETVRRANQLVKKMEEKKMLITDVSNRIMQMAIEVRSWLDDAAQLNGRTDDHIRATNASIDSIIQMTEELNKRNKTVLRRHRHRRRLSKVHHQVDEHVNHLVEQAKNLSRQFSGAKSEATNALEAANIYNDLKHSFHLIQTLVDSAKNDSEMAKEMAKDKPQLASASKNKSINIENQLKAVKESLDEAVDNDYSAKENLKLQKQILDESKEKLEQHRNNPMNTTAIESLHESERYLDTVDGKLSNIEEKMEKINEYIGKSDSEFKETINNNKNLRSTIDDVRKGYTRIKDTTDVIKSLIGTGNATLASDSKLSELKGHLQDLKEQLSRARDLVQRVHLTVYFGEHSSLELPLPERLTKSSSTTKIECYVKTASPNGLVVFYGNEDADGHGKSDYMTITLKNGEPHLTVALGDKPASVRLDRQVNDSDWWKITGEHTGRKLVIKAQKAGTLKPFENSQKLEGRRRLLDIGRGKGRLFVGGIPKDAKVNIAGGVPTLEGEIDSLIINGDYVPLWNMQKGRSSNIAGRTVRPLSEAESVSGMSFTGNGYAIMNLPGGGTPHKTNAFSVRFQTYNPDGLLYYSGKLNDVEFLSLGMVSGTIQLKYNLGSGELKLSLSNKTYNDGKPHTVDVNRRGRRVRLTVDKEFVDAESGGEASQLNTDTVYYIGGLPPQFEKVRKISPFYGCIKELKLDSHFVDLNNPNATKNVKHGCSYNVATTVSFPLDESNSVFTNIDLENLSEVSFHFKTEQQTGHLITIENAKEGVKLEFELENGALTTSTNGKRQFGTTTFSDGRWHFMALKRAGKQLQVEVDDVFLGELSANDRLFKHTKHGKLQFGRKNDNSLSFHGCISDVILDGTVLNFIEAQHDRIHISGCDMLEPETAEEAVVISSTQETITSTTTPTESTTVTAEPAVQRDVTACALSANPPIHTDDDRGQRFGLASDSRLEYNTLSTSFDMKSIFTVQIRPSALHGLIMLSKDRRNIDYISLYMVNGSVNFAFNAGHGAAILRSNRYLLDGKWHDIVAERYQRNGTLYVDGNVEDNGLSPVGSVSINSEPPLYIGGLPKDVQLLSSIAKVLPGLKPTFVGCMRNFTLNGVKLDNPSKHGLAACSEGVERGTYFGGKEGYVILHRNFSIEAKFTIELEVRARTKNAVLLSANGVDSFTIQLINGAAYFSVTNNGKTTTVSSALTSSNALCDGHWHSIKALMSKNVLMLTVDSKNALELMSDVSKNGMTINAPLYLGGVPKGTSFKSLNTTESYVGCIRYELKKGTRRMKKDLEFPDIEVFGDVNPSSCSAN